MGQSEALLEPPLPLPGDRELLSGPLGTNSGSLGTLNLPKGKCVLGAVGSLLAFCVLDLKLIGSQKQLPFILFFEPMKYPKTKY